MRSVRASAIAIALTLGSATSALAQQQPPRRPAEDPGALPPVPPLPPLPPPPAEPLPAPPSADVKVEWVAPAPQPPAPPAAPTTPERRDEPQRRWYGWQIMFTDGAALVSLSGSGRGSGWGYLALTLYLAGGPVVHFAHENGVRGVASLGLRVVGPISGALMGALVGSTAPNNCGGDYICFSPAVIGAGVGLVVGTLAASIVDIAALAYEKAPFERPAHSTSFGLHLVPLAGLPRDSTGHAVPTFGVGGAF
jgi:hypothetical protein